MPPQQGRGRPRKVCPKCRPPRSGDTVVQLGGAAVQDGDAGARKRDEPALVAQVRAQLVEADREATVDGVLALELAARISSPLTTGSAVATLARELTIVLERAVRGAKVEADPVADLAERRAAKAAAAGQ
jgi:hypothetical protein